MSRPLPERDVKHFFILLCLGIGFLSWSIGAGNCGIREIFAVFTGGELSETARVILFEVRLPRILAAFLAGGLLAAAGAASQNLFRNDLASPHVLGVIHAAALGAVCGLFFSLPAVLFAFLFAVIGLCLIFLPGRRTAWDGAILLFAGIAVNAFASSLTSGVIYLADERLSSIMFWLLGGFWRIGWGDVCLLGCAALIGFAGLGFFAPEIDLLLLGDRSAALSGVPLKQVKPLLLILIALMTAACVSCCGVIGFVGLAVPHIVRCFSGAKFSSLLPVSILAGGSLLMAADLAARTLFPPHEIPVGILTSAIGGPFFFCLLFRRSVSHD